jgi:hypothetical protein
LYVLVAHYKVTPGVCLYHKWPRICSVCGNHNPVFFSFMIFHRCVTRVTRLVAHVEQEKTNQSSIIFRDCKLVSVLMNIFQEAKWNWHRWSSTIRSTSEQQYAKWVYSWGTTRHIHIKRPTYSAQRNTVTFWRKSDLRNNEIVPCLPVIYKATECTCTRTHYG